ANFIMPSSWINAGTIKLRAKISTNLSSFHECGGCNDGANTVEVSDLTFQPSASVHYGYYRLTWPRLSLSPPDAGVVDATAKQVANVYPLVSSNFHFQNLGDIAFQKPPQRASNGQWVCESIINSFSETVGKMEADGRLPPTSLNAHYVGILPL